MQGRRTWLGVLVISILLAVALFVMRVPKKGVTVVGSQEQVTTNNSPADIRLFVKPKRVNRSNEWGVRRSDTARNFNTEIESLFGRLMVAPDPVERESIRDKISELKPAAEVLRFMLEKYEVVKDDEDRSLQVHAILTQINAAGMVDNVKSLAMTTEDEELFLDFVYQLRKANTVEAKKALFALLKDNRLPARSTDRSVLNNQGLVGAYGNLMDTLTPDDLVWLNESLETGTLAPAQMLTVREFLNKLRYEKSQQGN